MNKPTNATEMRELLLDYINALLLGGIPKAEFDAPKEEPDIERAAAELAELAKKLERLRSDEYQLMLNGVSTLYGENRETATERCYALFWEVQKMQLPGSWRNATRCCKCWTA